MRREIVKWPRVEQDLTGHFAYIAQDKIEPALRLLAVAEEAFDRLALMPSIGTAWRSKRPHLRDVRYYPMPAPYRSYLIFYRATAKTLEIMAVLHGARDLGHVVDDILEP
jgi:toxin ParE1/3/4